MSDWLLLQIVPVSNYDLYCQPSSIYQHHYCTQSDGHFWGVVPDFMLPSMVAAATELQAVDYTYQVFLPQKYSKNSSAFKSWFTNLAPRLILRWFNWRKEAGSFAPFCILPTYSKR